MAASKKTILIKSTLLDLSARIPKEIKALTREGYLVSVLGWARDYSPLVSRMAGAEKPYEEIRLKLRAPYGIKILPLLPIWWFFVFFQLMVKNWDIAHAINLDSAIPTVIASKLKRKPVVYEVLDIYEDQVVLPRILRAICIKVDKLFMWLANGVILADEMQAEEVGGIPNPKVAILYDSPPDILHIFDKTHQGKNSFTLFFGGGLSSARALNLDKVLNAIGDIEGVKIVITGHGDLAGEITERMRQMPDKIQFLGWMDQYEDVVKRIIDADLLFVPRDPTIPINNYTRGAKFHEAMMCGKPILINKGTSIATKVDQEKCGVAVDINNIEEIKETLVKLRDNPKLCQKLGANARKAYEQKYSWELMEQQLIALYHEVTS